MTLRRSIYILIGLSCLGLLWFGRLLIQGTGASSTTQQTVESSTDTIPPTNQLIIGNTNAPVTIIEYADFKCPNCGKFHSQAGKQIKDTYITTGLAKIIFRPYPLFGGEAPRLLAGSYCVANQNQAAFSGYHDKLLTYMWDNHYAAGNYDASVETVITGNVLNSILDELQINAAQYQQCLDDPSTKAVFDADLAQAGPDEVQGTPTLIIGGQKVVGPQPFEIYKTLIDLQLR